MLVFHNWTPNPITVFWNSKPYKFAPGEFVTERDAAVSTDGTRVLLEEGIVETWARQLSDEVAAREKINEYDIVSRETYKTRAKTAPSISAPEAITQPVVEEAPAIEHEVLEEVAPMPKKRGRPATKKVEPEFEGIE